MIIKQNNLFKLKKNINLDIMQQQFQQLYYSQILPHQDVYNSSSNIISNQKRLGINFILINIK